MSKKPKDKSVYESILAKDLMTKEVHVIKQDTLVSDVAHMFLKHRVSAYPVIDQNKKVFGVITLTDLFKILDKISESQEGEFHSQIANSKNLTAMEVMSVNVLSISPETTLDEIIHMIVINKIHTFPVMHNDKLVGIIGRHDVLNAVFASHEKKIK